MGMKLADIENTTRRKDEGAWIDGLPDLPDVAVKVRALWNSQYRRLYSELSAGLPPEQRKDPKVVEDLEIKLTVETVLLDWKGIDDLPYNKKNADKILRNPKYAAFREGVALAASIVAQRGRDTLEADTKNS